MARMIDAEELVEWLTKPTGFMANCEDCTEIDCLDCIIHEAIMNAPTIEAEPVKHGKWIEKYGTWYCSECDKTGYKGYIPAKPSNYCHNCGAMMDK